MTTWQQNAPLILLGGKVWYWKKSKKLKSQQKVPETRSYLTFKKTFFPKSKALEFNDGINQSYRFKNSGWSFPLVQPAHCKLFSKFWGHRQNEVEGSGRPKLQAGHQPAIRPELLTSLLLLASRWKLYSKNIWYQKG